MRFNVKIITIWFLINMFLGIIIQILLAPTIGWSLEIIAEVLIMTQVISTSSAFAGYSSSAILDSKKISITILGQNIFLRFLLIMSASILAALFSSFLFMKFVPGLMQEPEMFSIIYNTRNISLFFMVVIVITFLIASSAITLEYLQKTISKLKSANSTKTNDIKIAQQNIGLSIREQGNIYLIPYDQIYYVSSHGRYSVIHTSERQYKAVLFRWLVYIICQR